VSLAGLLTETIEIVRYAASTDEYGNTITGAEGRVTVNGRLEQLRTDEIIRDRDTVITDWRAFLPVGTDITPYDRIAARGALFEVVGLPNEHRTPRGPHHIEVYLRWVV
jgi:head-tail adaptor